MGFGNAQNRSGRRFSGIRVRPSAFDYRYSKERRDVLNNKVPGSGKQKVVQSRGFAEIRRKHALKAEQNAQSSHNVFSDRRIGENDQNLSEADRYLARYQREASQKLKRKQMYNLDGDDHDTENDSVSDDDAENGGLHVLTHGGKTLDEMEEDGDANELNVKRKKKRARGEISSEESEDDDEEFGDGDYAMDAKEAAGIQARYHFGGGEIDGREDRENRSHAEVMAEVMAKSKMYKAERRREKALLEKETDMLDNQFGQIVGQLPTRSISDAAVKVGISRGLDVPQSRAESKDKSGDAGDEDYDKYLLELAADRRAMATDRMPTKEEAAALEHEKLLKLERLRLRRMKGIEDDESESETGKRRKKSKRRVDDDQNSGGGDDLDDGFILEQDKLEFLDESSQDEDEIEREEESSQSSAEDEPDDDNNFIDESEEDSGLSDSSSDKEVLNRPAKRVVKAADDSKNGVFLFGMEEPSDDTIPFVYEEIPGNANALLELLEGRSPRQRVLVLSRLRTCIISSGSGSNNSHASSSNLKKLFNLVLNRLSILCSQPKATNLVSDRSYCSAVALEVEHLVPIVFQLAEESPESLVLWANSRLHHFYQKCTGVNIHPINKDAAASVQKNSTIECLGWYDLLFLRTIGRLFPVTDLRHTMTTSSVILMCEILSKSCFHSISQLASGVLIAATLCNWFWETGRVSGEFVVFLSQVLSSCVKQNSTSLSLWFSQEGKVIGNARCCDLLKVEENKSPFVSIEDTLAHDDNEKNEIGGRIYWTTLVICERYTTALLRTDNKAVGEVLQPIDSALDGVLDGSKRVLPDWLKVKANAVKRLVERAKIEVESGREPLELYARGVTVRKALNPRVDSKTLNPKHLEADAIRRAKKQLRKEQRSAAREIRKDSATLFRQQAEQRQSALERGNKQARQYMAMLEHQEQTFKQQVKKGSKKAAGKW